MPSVKVLVSRFPYGRREDPDVTDWLVDVVHKMKCDRRIIEVGKMPVDDTPIPMSRNRVMKAARDANFDLVLMIDSDMKPDLVLPFCKPFWDTSFEFMLEHAGPCMVAAPYCGPPPHENCYCFGWTRMQNDSPNFDATTMKLGQYSREEAYRMAGIREAAALPTGLCLIDVRCLAHVSPPWFEYEYEDPPYNTRKATTEDVYFSRNLSLAGVPCYVNWDAWAGHHKAKLVSKPQPLTVDAVREDFRHSILANIHTAERLVEVERHDGLRNGEVPRLALPRLQRAEGVKP